MRDVTPTNPHPRDRWSRRLRGIGAVVTLLGGLASEVALLLLVVQVGAHRIMPVLVVGLLLVGVGAGMMIVGKRWRREAGGSSTRR